MWEGNESIYMLTKSRTNKPPGRIYKTRARSKDQRQRTIQMCERIIVWPQGSERNLVRSRNEE